MISTLFLTTDVLDMAAGGKNPHSPSFTQVLGKTGSLRNGQIKEVEIFVEQCHGTLQHWRLR